ncbi:ribonuclease III [Rhodoligotrophos defluvii]|uniref:ribonuclease III n=1 Tax=Rhodoligotrophos defluvii TaxID=2561934 RepID=UPI0010C96FF1|nr:ribonuclease III [Rhodoligotrophos defluvii]
MGGARSQPSKIDKLVERIGYRFRSTDLLERALTHASFAVTHRKKPPAGFATGANSDNERLEFLGDRVLGLVVAEELLRRFPDSAEGELAPRFNALVRKETCAEVARSIELGRFLRLGSGEAAAGGRSKTAILGNACEAVIAAIYLDGGIGAARSFILERWQPHFDGIGAMHKDSKSALQEWAQGRGLPPPVYREKARSGPDHAPLFKIEVAIEGYPAQEGEGTSKRAAEQAAADAFMVREVASDRS